MTQKISVTHLLHYLFCCAGLDLNLQYVHRMPDSSNNVKDVAQEVSRIGGQKRANRYILLTEKHYQKKYSEVTLFCECKFTDFTFKVLKISQKDNDHYSVLTHIYGI